MLQLNFKKKKDISRDTNILEIKQETGKKHEFLRKANKSKETLILVEDRKGRQVSTH